MRFRVAVVAVVIVIIVTALVPIVKSERRTADADGDRGKAPAVSYLSMECT